MSTTDTGIAAVLLILAASACLAAGDGSARPRAVLERKADTFFTPVHLNIGDTLRFTLRNGQTRGVVVTDAGVDLYSDFGDTQHTLWADVEIDGHPLRLVYSPYRMKAQYEPTVVNGMRIALDGVGMLCEATGLKAKDAVPPADVRLWVNDAGLPVMPGCHVWSDLYQDQTRVHETSSWPGPRTRDYRIRQDRDIHVRSTTLSARMKTGWLGAWTYGVHEGLDLVLPISTPLYTVVDGAVHRGILSGGHRIWYSRTRPTGDVWWFGNSHCKGMVGKVGDQLKAGQIYAYSGNKTSRGTAKWPHAHAWLRLESASSDTYHLNPWIVMWQGIENKKNADGFIRAAIAPPLPAAAGEAIAFSSAASRAGPGGQSLCFRWHFDDGTTAQVPNLRKRFDAPGMHQAILVVSDGRNMDLDEVFFTVGPKGDAAPSVTLEPFAAPLLPRTNQRVTFSIRAAGPGGHDLAYRWDFGDGATATGQTVAHAFHTPGRHFVIVRVTDTVTKRSRMDWYLLDVRSPQENKGDADLQSTGHSKESNMAQNLDVTSTSAAEGFVRSEVDNPPCRRNELFVAFENYHSPRVQRLRQRYRLDEVVEGIDGEWERILALRHWIRSKIAIEDDHPTEARGEAFAILDAALAGGKFHCEHFSIVQHAVLNSFGYVTRRLQCGPGTKEHGGNHGVNEVWVNALAKWVLVDAKYDLHFEKAGLPLSALEIRDEVWRDAGASVVPVVGPQRKPLAGGPGSREWANKIRTYRWCAWETNTNAFTSFPATYTSTLVVLADAIFKANTWYRDGKPHWAYGTPYFIETLRRDWIEWTPNVIASKVEVDGPVARVRLSSFTPNFAICQVRDAGGDWRACDDRLELPLAPGRNAWAFRTLNLFGVAGPVHRVVVTAQ